MPSTRLPHVAKLSEKRSEHIVQIRTEDRWAIFSISYYRGTAEAALAEAREEGHKARLVAPTAAGREKVLIDENQPLADFPEPGEAEPTTKVADSDGPGL